jgi:hypothetical protein
MAYCAYGTGDIGWRGISAVNNLAPCGRTESSSQRSPTRKSPGTEIQGGDKPPVHDEHVEVGLSRTHRISAVRRIKQTHPPIKTAIRSLRTHRELTLVLKRSSLSQAG